MSEAVVGSTQMNATSSRAHSVIAIEFKQVERMGGQENVKAIFLVLVSPRVSTRLVAALLRLASRRRQPRRRQDKPRGAAGPAGPDRSARADAQRLAEKLPDVAGGVEGTRRGASDEAHLARRQCGLRQSDDGQPQCGKLRFEFPDGNTHILGGTMGHGGGASSSISNASSDSQSKSDSDSKSSSSSDSEDDERSGRGQTNRGGEARARECQAGLTGEIVRPRFNVTRAAAMDATASVRGTMSASRAIFNEKVNALDGTSRRPWRPWTRPGLA
mmetsp:Transcript_162783/g.521777  ORF Transcript_162783/g.521777 Transcript_162783/m.521777 type:complete len:273 (+) Transcript_162783:118-936(+)